jgi:CYTH domain-containing protein
MAQEIERKFLVKLDAWRRRSPGTLYRQGYLCSQKERVVRVRIAGDQAMLTIKGVTVGLTRSEFEYRVPVDDAVVMLDTLCERPQIEKHRHLEVHAGKTWEVDVFHGENEGLVIAELELCSETEPFEKPPWVGEEVSSDPRYFNSSLARNPYSTWGLP